MLIPRHNYLVKECKIDQMKLKCSSCDRTKHIVKVCISTLLQEKGKNNQSEFSIKQLEKLHSDYGIGRLETTNSQRIIDEEMSNPYTSTPSTYMDSTFTDPI